MPETSKRITVAKNYGKMIKATHAWKTKRHAHMAGIKKFHRSTAGKQMHRKLARILATRTSLTKDRKSLRLRPDRDTAREVLKIVSSYKTHILIEECWSKNDDLTERLDQYVFESYYLDVIHGIEETLLSNPDAFILTEEQIEVLFRLCSQRALINAFEQAQTSLPESFDNYYDSLGITNVVVEAYKGETK